MKALLNVGHDGHERVGIRIESKLPPINLSGRILPQQCDWFRYWLVTFFSPAN